MINFFIKTYGCQANVADSMHLAEYLKNLGCHLSVSEKDADLVIVNSCAIRQKAEQKLFSYLGSLEKFGEKKTHFSVAVIGCVATYRHKELKHKFPHIKLTFGAKGDREVLKSKLDELVKEIMTVRMTFRRVFKEDLLKANGVQEKSEFKKSMINIMRGCNNYCSYCIVPFTTGPERSFSMKEILEQVKHDVESGAKEINLLGQNVDSYKCPEIGSTFAELLKNVAKIEGEFWVRFVSPHPKDMTTEVLDVIAQNRDKLCAYVHLPLQSGSNKILKLMNRSYTRERFLDLVKEIKDRLPDATITTDIIVGFPGETEEDFLETIDLVKKVKFHTIFSFIYSPRKYTKAADMKDDCLAADKKKRLKILQDLHKKNGVEWNKNLIGKTFKVLLEEISGGFFWGRTEGNIRVKVKGENLKVNDFVNVKTEDAQLSDLSGIVKNSKQ